jgi:hypothetical protein
MKHMQDCYDIEYDGDCTCANRFPILSEGFEIIELGPSPTVQDLRFSQCHCCRFIFYGILHCVVQ